MTSAPHRAAAARVRSLLAALEANRELVQLGAYEAGRDPELDRALALQGDLESFLRQGGEDDAPFEATLARLAALAS